MAKYRVLITGASGLLGRGMFREFKKHSSDFDVLGLAFSRVKDGMTKVDLTKQAQVQEVIQTYKPNVVIHSAAERRPDVVENKQEETKQINVDATTTVCKEAGNVGAWVLYISSDYVFDGDEPPYEVDAKPNPLNKYGKSKLDGEVATIEASKENCILRVPVLYGQVESLNESAVTCLFSPLMDSTQPCKMNDRERRYPTCIDDLAVVIRQLVQAKAKDPSCAGVFHYSAVEQMTKYEMVLAMADVFSISADHVVADKAPAVGAKRPYNAQLSSSRLEQMGIGQRTPFKEAIKPCLEPFYKA